MISRLQYLTWQIYCSWYRDLEWKDTSANSRQVRKNHCRSCLQRIDEIIRKRRTAYLSLKTKPCFLNRSTAPRPRYPSDPWFITEHLHLVQNIDTTTTHDLILLHQKGAISSACASTFQSSNRANKCIAQAASAQETYATTSFQALVELQPCQGTHSRTARLTAQPSVKRRIATSCNLFVPAAHRC